MHMCIVYLIVENNASLLKMMCHAWYSVGDDSKKCPPGNNAMIENDATVSSDEWLVYRSK